MKKYSKGDIVKDRYERQGIVVAIYKTHFGYIYDVLISNEVVSYVEEDIFLVVNE